MKLTCRACGHSHLTMARTVSSATGEVKWWCHEPDHSCYNDNRGRYFE